MNEDLLTSREVGKLYVIKLWTDKKEYPTAMAIMRQGNFNLTDQVHRKIEILSMATGESKSAIVRKAIEAYSLQSANTSKSA